MKSRAINIFIEDDLKNVSLIGIAVNAICASLQFDEEESYQMELCVAEAVNNCILHAYEKTPGHIVGVKIRLLPDRVVFKVCDTGRSMKSLSDHISTLEFDPNDLTTVPDGGLGLFIIHKLMDNVFYEHAEGENTLTMTKRLW